MDAHEKMMKNLEGYVGMLKSEIDNISEERLCPCKALEMDDNACDGCGYFRDEQRNNGRRG